MKTIALLMPIMIVGMACSAEQFPSTEDATTVSHCDDVKCDWPAGGVAAEKEQIVSTAENQTQLGDPTGHCPSDMRYVSGSFCTKVKETCAEWMDPETQPARRCKRFLPSECIGKRISRAFCIDTNEYFAQGEALPMGNVDANHAKVLCANEGKRLCKESEWIYSCEGEQMLPYATGYDRPDSVCNIDHTKHMGRVGHLTDYRVASSAMAGCRSPYGIVGQIGNVDEITIRDVSRGKYSIALHGGWWGPLRNRCEPATVAHSEIYSDLSLGFRCCEDDHKTLSP